MTAASAARRIVHRTRGTTHGPITRLMSPGDLGEVLKPFVFLDRFAIPDASLGAGIDLHPHSGIATVTVITDGDVHFDDGEGHSGTIGYGGVEWMRAGRGVWHGRELGPGSSPIFEGFQLWLALDADLELSVPDGQYLEADRTPAIGPARLIVGRYQGAESPVRAPAGINYLLVTLKPGETWRYDTPADHAAGWLALSRGTVTLGGEEVRAGDMAVLDRRADPIELRSTGSEDAVLVLGTAVPHPHALHLGYHSVHTSAAMLAEGERHIAALRTKLLEREARRQPGGVTPVLR